MKIRSVKIINQDSPEIIDEYFAVPSAGSHLSMDFDTEPELAMLMYVLLTAPDGSVRLFKQLGHGERRLCLGPDSLQTSLGGVAGPIDAGTWRLRFYVAAQYLKQMAADRVYTLRIIIQDKPMDIQESVGENDWAGGIYGAAPPGRLQEGRLETISDWRGQAGGYEIAPCSRSARPCSGGSACGRWYKGDFHTHTHLSDGKETVRSAMEKAVRMGLDFYVPTEHNVLHTGWPAADILIIPGVEITTQKGHMNLFGVDRMPGKLLEILENMDSPRTWPLLLNTLTEAERYGWTASINHPFLTQWQWLHEAAPLAAFSCMEIINDPTYPPGPGANDRAIRFLDLLWQDGHRIYGIGGSDSHNKENEWYDGADGPSIAGDPGTWVYSTELTQEKILHGLRCGHVYVSRFCTLDIRISGEDRDYLPGDEISGAGFINYHMEINGLREKPLVYRVYNGKKIPLEVTGVRPCVYSINDMMELGHEPWEWLRMEVRRSDGTFLAYVNPVYHGSRTPRWVTFGDAVRYMSAGRPGGSPLGKR